MAARTILMNGFIASFATDTPYGAYDPGAIILEGDMIHWVGAMDNLPPPASSDHLIDLQGKTVTPGLIDCHTHLIYSGTRAREFEQRLLGASYQDIANSGGGILSTVRDTRAASFDRLYHESAQRLSDFCQQGVTTLEVKSGYGLDFDTEQKMLLVAQKLEQNFPIRILKTFLGAHSLPPEFTSADLYIKEICQIILPKLAHQGLVDAVDIFCETIAFSTKHAEALFTTAHALNLPVKMHAEQLSNIGGSQLAAKFNALSVDHLEYLTVEDIQKLRQSKTVATLLPAAFYTLRETKRPPIDLLRQSSIPMALATDCNPGTAPTTSLLLALNMGCTLFELTPEEALRGVTLNAAKALNLDAKLGSLSANKQADLCIWNVAHPSELCYLIGQNKLLTTYKAGKKCTHSLS